jgi:hypothetical protein
MNHCIEGWLDGFQICDSTVWISGLMLCTLESFSAVPDSQHATDNAIGGVVLQTTYFKMMPIRVKLAEVHLP